jgi:MoaA/NifB/PqqE/SkfB family radical SAM enzyme
MEKTFDLTEYMSGSVEKLVKDALRSASREPGQALFFIRFLGRCRRAARIRKRFEKQGRHIPPFLIASISSECNLFCKGCYARANKPCAEANSNRITSEKWASVFSEADKLGISFTLLAGGEPFLRKDVIEIAAKQKNICFPVFTNGTLIKEDSLRLLSEHRNLIPVVSIEGNEEQTDERRGRGVYQRVIDLIKKLNEHGIFYGTSVTVTTKNIDSVTDTGFIEQMAGSGCKLVFYVEYVPVTEATRDLALSGIERDLLEEKVNALRERYGRMLFLSFPGDEKNTGGCLAAGRGFFHISVNGDAEPCPFSPYSDTNIRDKSLLEALQSPLFSQLSETGMLNSPHKGGCALFDRQNEVKALLNSDSVQL